MSKARLAFIDRSPVRYDLSSPETEPLGASQTSVCLLIRDLLSAGWPITLATSGGRRQSRTSPEHIGVEGLNVGDIPDLGALISINHAPTEQDLTSLPRSIPIILWMHNASTSWSAESLRDPHLQARLAQIVVPSHWSASQFIGRFGIPSGRVSVIHNQILPVFAELRAPSGPVREGKIPGRLIYASAPNRGLHALLDIFPRVRAARPHVTLEIFSGFTLDQGMTFTAPTGAANGQTGGMPPPEELFRRLAALPGVTVHRGVPKPVLADHMAMAEIFAYPCMFPETACITALEASLAGCVPVVTDAGALPETLGRQGIFTRYNAESDSMDGQAYADQLVKVLDHLANGGERLEDTLRQQVDSVRRDYFAGRQTGQWQALIASLEPDLV